jgi:glucose/arabinose dehydrogenase
MNEGVRVKTTRALLLIPLLSAQLVSAAHAGAWDDEADAVRLTNLRDERIVAGLEAPTAFAFLPDGRILIAEQRGIVRLVTGGQPLPKPFVDLRFKVNDFNERGLLDVAVDPLYLRNRYVYLYYAYEHNPAHPEAETSMRLTRLRAVRDRALPATETVVLGTAEGSCDRLSRAADCIPADCGCHTGGEVEFAADGTLFLSTGDGARAAGVNDDAPRSQSLDSLAGKLLHVSREGRGLATNPFWNRRPASNRSKIWSFGFRNPFRFGLHPAGTPIVGDVGWRGWEEIDFARAGENFGWPCYEGRGRQPDYAATAGCRRLFAARTRVSPPLYAYARGRTAASVIGGPVLAHSEEATVIFFGDFARGWIRYIQVDREGDRIGTVMTLSKDATGIADLEIGPDGMLYYLSISSGELRRIHFGRLPTSPGPPRSAL